jgi:uncharacterized repeat protein (TIGR01451 family)
VRDLRLLATLVFGSILGVAQPAGAEILPSADVGVSVSDNRSPEPVVAGVSWSGYGEGLTYSIAVQNNGTVSAQEVTVGDSLPPHTTFISFNQTSGPPFTLAAPPPGAKGTVTATAATLSGGAIASFELTLAVDADTAEGTMLSDTAKVTSQSFDPVLTNNSATTTTRVTTYAAFFIEAFGSPQPVLRGHDITHGLTVQNNGPSDAQAVELSDQIPTGTTFVSFAQDSGPPFIASGPASSSAGGTVTATIGTLAVGERGIFTLVVRVDPDTPDGKTISNTVSVNSSTRCAYSPTVRCGPLATGARAITRSYTCGTRVSAFAADLAVSISDSPDPVQAGADLSYAISVVNTGPDAATNIYLRGHVPVGTTLVSFVQDSGPAFTLNDPAAVGGRLAACEAAAFTLVVRVDPSATAGTVIDNTAEIMWSDTSDPEPANDGARAKTNVVVGSPPG